MSQRAVVPVLGCPTMKKSGMRPPPAPARAPASERGSGCPSAKLVIAPQRDEVAVEVLAERLHLGSEAPAQLERERLVGGARLGEDDLAPDGAQRLAAQRTRRERLDRRLHGARSS